jgi:hypothetical protein
MKFFHGEKRTLCNRKKGTCQNLGGSYAPDYASKESSTQIVFVFYWQYIKIPIRNPRNPRNVLSNFLWSFLSGPPKVRPPPPSLDTLTPSEYTYYYTPLNTLTIIRNNFFSPSGQHIFPLWVSVDILWNGPMLSTFDSLLIAFEYYEFATQLNLSSYYVHLCVFQWIV